MVVPQQQREAADVPTIEEIKTAAEETIEAAIWRIREGDAAGGAEGRRIAQEVDGVAAVPGKEVGGDDLPAGAAHRRREAAVTRRRLPNRPGRQLR
jgi:hypothetical protein